MNRHTMWNCCSIRWIATRLWGGDQSSCWSFGRQALRCEWPNWNSPALVVGCECDGKESPFDWWLNIRVRFFVPQSEWEWVLNNSRCVRSCVLWANNENARSGGIIVFVPSFSVVAQRLIALLGALWRWEARPTRCERTWRRSRTFCSVVGVCSDNMCSTWRCW